MSFDYKKEYKEFYMSPKQPGIITITKIELLQNLDKLHTTELGVMRIKKNLALDTDNVVEWCKAKIISENASVLRNGKNWYINIDDCIITVNAYSYTIITAHKQKK